MEPAGRIEPQAWMTARPAAAVVAALGAEGRTVRFVGGCVRDAVLGRPVRDVDVATPDPPETVIRLLEAAGIKAVPTGVAHGTVTAVVEGAPVEVTTLRRDVETHGRHATVAFTDDWTADAARRDFTINALFCDPDGTLYDPFGGLADLEAGRVRFVGEAARRIDEDVLRLLRFFRIYAHYGRPPPDPDALAACRAKAGKLATLSAERVRNELLKLLEAPDPTEALGLMAEGGVLAEVLPEATRLDGLAELCAVEGDAGDPLRRLALLLRRAGGGAAAVAERLRLSNADAERLAAMVAPPIEVVAGLDVAARRRALYRLGRTLYVDLALLAWAEALAREHRDAPDLGRAYEALLVTARDWQAPELPVKGADAVRLGVPAGPAVGELLAAVEAWWIDRDFRPDRDEALAKLAALAAARPAQGGSG